MADLKVNPTPLKQDSSSNWDEWKNTFGAKPPRPDSKFTGFAGQPTAPSSQSTQAPIAPNAAKRLGELTQTAKDLNNLFKISPRSFWEYFLSEIGWGASTDTKLNGSRHMANIARVPFRLERFLLLGVLVCWDLLLHNFTFLPLRFVHGIWQLLLSAFQPRPKQGRRVNDAMWYDLVRGGTILLAAWSLSFIQISYVYHYIRGEAIIKLYVIFNILEIFDKLLCALGQDILDGLYRSTLNALPGRGKPGVSLLSTESAHLAGHIIVAVLYVTLHSTLLFVQIVCFNVAMNSRSNALLTLLISNNFIELKAAVFKRFEAENLFQVSCSDAVERFQLLMFLSLIFMQDYAGVSSLSKILPMAGFVLCAEAVVDYVKHCFIAKFNRIDSSVYKKFMAILGHDVVNTRLNLPSTLDPTHSRGRRLGVPVVAMTCVWIRLTMEKLAALGFHVVSWDGALYGALLFVALLCVKLVVSMCLLYFSYSRVIREPQLALRLKLREALPSQAAAATRPVQRGGAGQRSSQPRDAAGAPAASQPASGFITPAIPQAGAGGGGATQGQGGVSAAMVAAHLKQARGATPAGARAGARALFSHVLTPSLTPVQGEKTPLFPPLAPSSLDVPEMQLGGRTLAAGGSAAAGLEQDDEKEGSVCTTETDMFSLHSAVTDSTSAIPASRAFSAQSGTPQGGAGSPLLEGGVALSRGASGFSEIQSGSDSGRTTPLMHGVGGLGHLAEAAGEAFTVPPEGGGTSGGRADGDRHPLQWQAAGEGSLRQRVTSHGGDSHSSGQDHRQASSAMSTPDFASALQGTNAEFGGGDGVGSDQDSSPGGDEEDSASPQDEDAAQDQAEARMWRTMSDGTLDAVVDGVDRYTLRSGRIPM